MARGHFVMADAWRGALVVGALDQIDSFVPSVALERNSSGIAIAPMISECAFISLGPMGQAGADTR
jgi:hypothetical protein